MCRHIPKEEFNFQNLIYLVTYISFLQKSSLQSLLQLTEIEVLPEAKTTIRSLDVDLREVHTRIDKDEKQKLHEEAEEKQGKNEKKQ